MLLRYIFGQKEISTLFFPNYQPLDFQVYMVMLRQTMGSWRDRQLSDLFQGTGVQFSVLMSYGSQMLITPGPEEICIFFFF